MVERVGVDDAGVDGGSSGRFDKARGERWPWLRRQQAAATASVGREREVGRDGSGRGGPGVCVAS